MFYLDDCVALKKAYKGEDGTTIKAGSVGNVEGFSSFDNNGRIESSCYVQFKNDSADVLNIDLKKHSKKNDKYEVLLKGSFSIEKGEYYPQYELSVIKKNNHFGHSSYGWDGKDKIILFTQNKNMLPYSKKTGVFKKNREIAMKIAQNVCNTLNKEKL